MILSKTHQIQSALESLNSLRNKYGGCSYSMTQIKRFAAGSRCDRLHFLQEWLAVYTELGPTIVNHGLTIDSMDSEFIADRGVGFGPEAYRTFVVTILQSSQRPTRQVLLPLPSQSQSSLTATELVWPTIRSAGGK